MKTVIRRKILLAVDGSDQALEAVRYISAIAHPDRTDVVLFYVGFGFPEVFWDMNNNPLYRSKKDGVMGWLADHQVDIGEFKEKAYKILADAGIPEKAVSVKTQARKTGVLKDIIQESYRDYSAVVLGRTGANRLKDFFIDSMAYKLAEKVKHIPSVIVAGKPTSRKILIALDESIEAMRAVSCVGALAGAADLEFALYHCLVPPARFRFTGKRPTTFKDEISWRSYNEKRFRPYMDEATQRLEAAGIGPEQINRGFIFARGNIIQKIVDTAQLEKFGTILVGRRESASFVQEHVRGRFGGSLVKALDDTAVWIVS